MTKTLKNLSVIATVIMVLVLLGGALVTKTESGMGCGANWPDCQGDLSIELFIELSHRLVSGVAGIVVLLLSVLSWKYLGHIREVKFLSFVSSFFLILQALIGAAAVLWAQSDFVLAMHFGISLISFAAVFLLTLLIFEIDQKFDAESLIIDKNLRKHFYGLTAYILLVVYTGALVRHANASLVCGSWPACSKDSLLPFGGYAGQWIQMGHRLAAGVAFVWTIYLLFKIMRRYRASRVMTWGWISASMLMVFQVGLGALIIFTMLNLAVALFHALVITIYFGVLSYFILLSSRSAKYERSQSAKPGKAG